MKKDFFVVLFTLAIIGECLLGTYSYEGVLTADFGISAIISAIIAAASIAIGVGTSAASAAKANKAKREELKKGNILETQRAEEKAEFNKDYYRPITEATDVQDTLRILQENQRMANERTDARGAVTGTTDEVNLANREINRKTFADSLATQAVAYAERKRQDKKDHMQNEKEYYKGRLGLQDQIAGIYMNESNQMANTASNAFKQGATIASQTNWEVPKSAQG